MANRYFLNVGTNWNDTANWSTSSGGAGGASVPGTSDVAIFDVNSGNCIVEAGVDPSVSGVTLDALYTKTFDTNGRALTIGYYTLGDLSIAGGFFVNKGVKASLSCGPGGTPMVFTAKAAGPAGNNVRLTIIDPGGDHALTYAEVVGGGITVMTVTLAYSGGAITSTTADVVALVQANSTVADASGGSATLAIAMVETALANGAGTTGGGAIACQRDVLLSGGSFTSTSGILYVSRNFTQSGGTFIHNSGTVNFFGGNSQLTITDNLYKLTTTNASYNHTFVGTVNVTGELVLASGSITGVVHAKGDIKATTSGALNCTSSDKIIIDGTGAQNLYTDHALGIGTVIGLEINKVSGTLTIDDKVAVKVYFKYITGTVVFGAGCQHRIYSGAGVSWTTGTLTLACDVYIDLNSYGLVLGNDMYIAGNLTTAANVGGLSGGDIYVTGDVTTSSTYFTTASSKAIVLNGTGSQTLSTGGTGMKVVPGVRVAKPSGTLFVQDNIQISGGGWTWTSGTVNFGTSTVTTGSSNSTFNCGSQTPFYKLTVDSGTYSITLASDVYVSNLFTITGIGGFSGAYKFYLQGDITSTDSAIAAGSTMQLNGTGNQTITGPGMIGPLEINKLSGNVIFGSSFKCISSYNNMSSAPIVAGTYTLTMCGQGATLITSEHSLYSLEYSLTYPYNDMTVIGTPTLAGNLIMTQGRLVGTVRVQGNITATANQGYLANGGTAAIILDGTGNQTIDCALANAMPSGTFTIAKTAGTVTLLSNLVLNTAGQDFTISAGTFDLAGYNLTVNDVLTIGGFGIFKLKGSGTVTKGSLVQSVGATVVYYDSAVTAVLNAFSTSFQNLTLGASKQHNVTAGTTITVAGNLKSDGTSAARSKLRSSSDGTQWNLNLSGFSDLEDRVDVKDSNADSGKDVLALGSLNSGNNSSWIFATTGGGGVLRSGVIQGAAA